MANAVFVTDLHGSKPKYKKLYEYIAEEGPEILLIGGDLLPHSLPAGSLPPNKNEDFINNFLAVEFSALKTKLKDRYPEVFLIMGNDDPRYYESSLLSAGDDELWIYLHNRKFEWRDFVFYGYNYVPPSPFLLKDWERYDVSRYTDIGCISPEEGKRTVPVSEHDSKWTTIKEDLDVLTEGQNMDRAVFLFHAPPYNTCLDKGDTGGKVIDYVAVDEHMGSIAIERFIEEKQPYITLHGHIHESTEMTGCWKIQTGKTVSVNGAHDGPELCVVELDIDNPLSAKRVLI